jgi:single-strand DNA-binding protein
MGSYNRVVLVGNLTRDPQLSYTPANTAVCKFGIATNRTWKDRDGNSREEVCFVDCTVFGRAGETFNQYMSKGRSVLVEGRLHFSQWTTSEGDKRSKHEVVVENFTFLGSGRGGEGAGAPAAAGSAESGSGSPAPPSDDGIPF